jgi:hypothetical protein
MLFVSLYPFNQSGQTHTGFEHHLHVEEDDTAVLNFAPFCRHQCRNFHHMALPSPELDRIYLRNDNPILTTFDNPILTTQIHGYTKGSFTSIIFPRNDNAKLIHFDNAKLIHLINHDQTRGMINVNDFFPLTPIKISVVTSFA